MTLDWWRKSQCAEEELKNPALLGSWLKRNGPNAEKAYNVCVSKCPVRTECLVAALREKDAEGLRGGFFFENGTVWRQDFDLILRQFGLRARKHKSHRKAKAKAESVVS